MVYFLKKKLPWQNITGTKKMERYIKIYKMKKFITPEKLCEGIFPEMAEFIAHAKNLEFVQEPDYNFLRKLYPRRVCLDKLRLFTHIIKTLPVRSSYQRSQNLYGDAFISEPSGQ